MRPKNKKMHFFNKKTDMPNTLLSLERAQPNHVGWAFWPKAQTQKHDLEIETKNENQMRFLFEID